MDLSHEELMLQHREDDDSDHDHNHHHHSSNVSSGSNIAVGFRLNDTIPSMDLVHTDPRLARPPQDTASGSTPAAAVRGSYGVASSPLTPTAAADQSTGASTAADANDPAAAAGGAGAGTWKRLNDIRAASSREKKTLLQRIEELSRDVRESQHQLAEKEAVIQRYHTVLGPLHEFSSKQVQLREEIVSLHDAVRLWQQREADGRDQVRQLERTIAGLTRSGDHDSAESRLSDLQQRLAHAHLQRNEILAEASSVERLVEQQNQHTSEFQSATLNLPEQHQWRYRGKLAELKVQAQSKSDLISSLDKAVRDVQALVDDNKGHTIGEVNRKCAGCGKPQWTSAFCPKNGHRHLGFGDDLVDAAVERGEWKRLVHAGTCEESFQHVATGRIVTDLAAELVGQGKAEGQSPANKPALSQPSMKPAPTKEIEALIKQLKVKNEENAKLKQLLKTVAKSGMVGVPIVPSTAESGYERSATQQPTEPTPAAKTSAAPAGTASVVGWDASSYSVPIYNEDDVEYEAKLQRLQQENGYLNKRCSELILQVADSSDTIRSLKEQIRNHMPTAKSTMEFQLKEELAALKEDLLKEQRRCLALEDQLRRATRSSFR